MPEAAKAFRTPAKMDADSKAASESKSDESMQGLEEEKGAQIESSEPLGRISEDPEGAQEPFLMGLDETNKMEPGGAEWEDDLSEDNSDDWRQSYTRERTTFPQLTPLQVLQRKLKRSTRKHIVLRRRIDRVLEL